MSPSGCADFPSTCGPLQPNADIAGIGVYIAFMLSASLTYLASTVAIFVEYFLFAATKSRSYDGTIRNKTTVSSLTIVRATLGPLILGLADQQMVTGLAILIAALKDWNSISAYHFNLVVYIAWFSSFTHVMALIGISNYPRKSMTLLTFRVIGFTAVFALYIFAQVRSRTFGHAAGLLVQSKGDYPGAAAACLAKCSAAESFSSSIEERCRIVTLIMLLILGCIGWFREGSKRLNHSWIFVATTLLSMASGGLALMSLIVGILCAFRLRDLNRYPGLLVADNFGDQNEWSFGQLVAVVLLVLPLLAAFEGLLGERAKQKEEAKERKDDRRPNSLSLHSLPSHGAGGSSSKSNTEQTTSANIELSNTKIQSPSPKTTTTGNQFHKRTSHPQTGSRPATPAANSTTA